MVTPKNFVHTNYTTIMWSWSEKVLGDAIGQLQARPKQLFSGCLLPWEYDYQHYKLGPIYIVVGEVTCLGGVTRLSI